MSCPGRPRGEQQGRGRALKIAFSLQCFSRLFLILHFDKGDRLFAKNT